MKRQFSTIDLRRGDVFPGLAYRFSSLRETDSGVELERDFLGENPLHYYMDTKKVELIIASNIQDIKIYLEKHQRGFSWERVRAVSGNTKVTIDDQAFASASPKEEEMGPTLQDYELRESFDCTDLRKAGRRIRELLQESIETRLQSIPDQRIGLLLSGGLDSMSVGYLLSKVGGKEVIAFTLKVDEDEKDISKSREIARKFQIELLETKIGYDEKGASITLEEYSPQRELLYSKRIAEGITLDKVIRDSLDISGSPKKDNLFCAAAMYLAGQAIRSEGVETVFCGEGPNEMINDYGYCPRDLGYPTDDKGDMYFREALTFGLKKTDRQLGRGGLPKHAIARMGKMFAHHGLRLEAPYFDRDIARIMTRVPHITSYDTIKQHLVGAMFEGEGLECFIQGTSKEKFQDGSGISRMFASYDQKKLVDEFEKLYGIEKTGYLTSAKK